MSLAAHDRSLNTSVPAAGTVPVGHNTGTLISFAAILILARAFANGGSSLTGIEAVSNAVSALRPRAVTPASCW